MYNIGTLGKLYIMVHLVFFGGVDHVKVSVTLHLEQRIMCFFGISNGAMGRLVDSCQVLKNKGISLLTFRTARVPVVYLPLWKIWVKVSWDMLRWWNSHVPNQMSYPSSNAMVPPNTQWNLGFHHGSITFPIDLALGPDQLAPWSVSLFQAKRNALGMLRYAKYLGFLKVFGKMFIRCFSYIICVYGGFENVDTPITGWFISWKIRK